jgi:hypothetical protein
MLIEVTDPRPPFYDPLDDCHVTVTVGGIVYNVGETERSELQENLLAFRRGLQGRSPFTPEFAYEPLFNVDFVGDQFVVYTYRPRFKHHRLWWLGSIKVVSEPESVSEATAYLTQFLTSLQQT